VGKGNLGGHDHSGFSNWDEISLRVQGVQSLKGTKHRVLPDRNEAVTFAVAAAVTRQRRFRDVVRGIIESIETRISYGQSRLRFLDRNNG